MAIRSDESLIPIVIRSDILTSAFIQARLMSAAIIKILIAKNSTPISMANTLEWRNAISVKTALLKIG